MNRRKLEATTTYLSVIIFGLLTFILILAMADGLFNWNLLPISLEKLAMLVLGSLGMILVACVIVSITLNISIIAHEITKISDRNQK